MYGIINHPTESPFFPNTPKSFDIESNSISIIYCKKRSNKLPHLLSVFSLRSSMMLISKCLIWDLGVGIWGEFSICVVKEGKDCVVGI